MYRFRGVRPGKANNIEIRWQVKGKPRRSLTIEKPPTEKNQADAARLKDRLKELDRRGEYETQFLDESDRTNPLFEEVCADYLKYKSKELAQSTLYNYAGMLERYWSDLATRNIRDIRLAELRSLDSNISWKNQKTHRNALDVLRQVFNFAFDNEVIENNPTLKMRAGKWQKPPIDAFSVEEKNKILDALPHKYRMFYRMMFDNGLRTGEVLALKFDDIKSNGTLRVERVMYKGKARPNTKTHQARDVRLSAITIKELKDYKETIFSASNIFQNKERWLFVSREGGLPYKSERALTSVFKGACEQAGVRYRRPYFCRHSYVSHALAKGLKPEFVATQIGDLLNTMLANYATWIKTDNDLLEMAKFNREE